MSHKQDKDKERHKTGWRGRRLVVAWVGVALCSMFTVAGFLVFAGGVRQWRIGSASLIWPMTQAEITRTALVKGYIRTGLFGISFGVYQREISVRYLVNAEEYNSKFRLRSDRSNDLAPNHAQEEMSAGADNERITIYYNPENPREVTLFPGDRSTAVSGLVVGSSMAVVCSMLVLGLAWHLANQRTVKGRD